MEIYSGIFLKNTLLKHSIFSSTKTDIIKMLSDKIPEISKLRLNQELTDVVCNLIENLPTTVGVDKKQLAIDILTATFNLDENEKLIVSNQVQYIYDNDMIIKLSKLKVYLGYVKEFIKRKLN